MNIKSIIKKLKVSEDTKPQEQTPAAEIPNIDSNLFAAVFKQHPDGIVLFNSDGKVVDCNNNITSIFGYSLEELQQDFFQFVDDDYVRTTLRNFKKALKGETREYISVRIKKDGTRYHVKTVLTPIIVDNMIRAVVGIFRDYNEIATIKDHMKRAQQVAAVGSWDYFPSEDMIYWSDEVYSLFGIKDKSSFVPTIGKFLNMIHPEDSEVIKQVIDRAIKGGIGYELEFRFMKLGGEIRTGYVTCECIVRNDGKVLKLTGTMQDITEKKVREHLVQQTEKQLLNIIQTVDAAVISFDVQNNKLLFCSDAVSKIFGVPAKNFEIDPDYWKTFIHPEDIEKVEEVLKKLVHGKKVKLEYRIIDASGKLRWVDDHLIPALDENGDLIRVDGIISEISERKEYQERLEYIANHDYLTGLPNRRNFETEFSKAVDKAIKYNRKLSLLMLDLDRFKNVNDALGHEVGDKLLIEVSKRLLDACSKEAFLARVGGDEFGIFIENIIGMDASIALSHKMLKKFEEPFIIDDFELYITACIGITFTPYNGDNAATLLKNADVAMYRAKESGRNDYYVYTPSMNVETFKRYSLEKGLHTALKNNEFYLEYQPKVNPKTGKMESAEALLRWKHPEWGIVSPSEFIPLAEESGLILNIGDWVVKEVCQKLKEWLEQGYKLVPISINISYKRIIKQDFLKSILTIVKEVGIHPRLIEFEIIERTMIQNEEVVKSVMTKMQALGFKFALDDFGTCQSSLSYLSTFEVDVIKFDRSFTQEIGRNKRIESIITNIIALAEDLSVKIVAEGVETEEQLTFLLERNCHLIQGYLYSRPVPANIFEQLLKRPFISINGKREEKRQHATERRKQYRVNVAKLLLVGEMTITKIKGQEVNMGYSKVLIQNLGKGGLSFLSQINLPLNHDIILKFTIKIGGHILALSGEIVWKQDDENDVFKYGIRFTTDENDQIYLNKVVEEIRNDSANTLSPISFSGSVKDFFNDDDQVS